MLDVKVNLHGAAQAHVRLNKVGDGRRFAAIEFDGGQLIVMPPGFDAECAIYMRTLGRALLDAASQMTPAAAPAEVVKEAR